MTNFDLIAPYYDIIARLVFGQDINLSQKELLPHIEKGARVLFIGGGSGWLLPFILVQSPECQIDYLEGSQKMIELARKRTLGDTRIRFIHGSEDDIPAAKSYDVVITAYFLDIYAGDELSKIMGQIARSARPGGVWLLADFSEPVRRVDRLLLPLMYWFFKLTCGLRNQKLEDFDPYFLNLDYFLVSKKYRRHDFIQSKVWKRNH